MKNPTNASKPAMPDIGATGPDATWTARRRACLAVGSLLLLGTLSACSGMSNRGENTAIGAGAGAVAGAVLTGGSGVGTVGGAVVGGVIGNSVEKDKKK